MINMAQNPFPVRQYDFVKGHAIARLRAFDDREIDQHYAAPQPGPASGRVCRSE
jgi:hypothetical protein